MKFMVPRLAKKYARKYSPIIFQGFKSVYDPIVPIHLGDFDPALMERPTVYFAARQDKDYRYLLYCFFHRKDWSEWIWPFKALDEHEYDFEGCLIAQEKSTNRIRRGLSVFHNNFKYTGYPWGMENQTVVAIEPGGHGVSFHPGRKPLKNEIIYRDYDLVNMANPSTLKWLKKEVQPAFNSTNVKMPWQWNDEDLVTHYGRERTEGLMWRNPRLLFELARKAKLLR